MFYPFSSLLILRPKSSAWLVLEAQRMSVEGRNAEVVKAVAEGVVEDRLIREGFRDNSNLDPRLGKSDEYESGSQRQLTLIY